MEKKRVPIDDFYWYIEMKQGGPTVRCDTEKGRPVDEWRFQENNYFDTKTKAEIVAKKICEVLNSMCEKQPLFENAKFGDRFFTRDGHEVIFLEYYFGGNINDKNNPPFTVVHAVHEEHIFYQDGTDKRYTVINDYDVEGHYNRFDIENEYPLDVIGKKGK